MLKKSKLRLGAVAVAVCTSTLFGAISASADPAAGTFKALSGVGSDTTQDLVAGLASAIPAIGSYDATGGGTIQASLGTAPRGAEQRLSTTTGEIQVGLDDNFDGELELATSALFATDYSLDVIRHPGEEPNKIAHALIGARASKLSLLSRRGQISLLRRAPFSAPGAPPSAAGAERDEQEQEESDSD